MEINKKAIEYHIKEIIKAIGDDPEREGLIDTPKRVAKMYEEIFEGMKYSNAEIAEKFGATFSEEEFCDTTHNNLVVVGNIPIFSYCEHHMALMYNMRVAVVYKPKDVVIGLSKIARIADMVGRRLQLQERIGKDIAEIIQMVTKSEAVGVLISGEHSCMSARGIKKEGTKTLTTTFLGSFKEDINLRNEALLLLKEV